MRTNKVIKLFKPRKLSPNDGTRLIVVGYNKKSGGGYIVEKIGVFYKEADKTIIFLNTNRLFYWLNKNAILKSKVSWILGFLGQSEFYGKKKY